MSRARTRLRLPLRDPPPLYFIPLVSITFVLWLGSSILHPVLPLFAGALGLSHTDVGMVVGAFFAGRLVCDLAAGFLVDRYTVRFVARLGCAITGVASCFAGLAESLPALVIARMVQGGGAGIYLTVAMTAVISISPPDRVGRSISLYQGLGLVGFSVGPVVGGIVAHFGGLRAPFFMYAAVSLVGVVVATTALPDHPLRRAEPAQQADEVGAGGLGDLLRSRAFVIVLAVATVAYWARSGIRNNLVPLFAETLGLGEVAIGLMLSLAAVANVAVLGHAGRALDRGRRPVVIGGAVATGLATAALGMVFQPWMLFAGCVLLAVATGYGSVAPTVVTADITTAGALGRSVGVLRMATDLGLMVGPVMAGALSDAVGLRAAFGISGGVICGLALFTFLLPETHPKIAR